MFNMPHAILDGCSHTYYIDIDDMELVEEIKKLNDERLAAEAQKKKDNFPGKVENAKEQCREMIEELTRWANGEFKFGDDALLRIENAHFNVCHMLTCDRP
jgi:RNA polymerase-binding transcription factor DksA